LCKGKEHFEIESAEFNKTISLGFQDSRKGKIVSEDSFIQCKYLIQVDNKFYLPVSPQPSGLMGTKCWRPIFSPLATT